MSPPLDGGGIPSLSGVAIEQKLRRPVIPQKLTLILAEARMERVRFNEVFQSMQTVIGGSTSELINYLYDVQRAAAVKEAFSSMTSEVGSRPDLDPVLIEDAVQLLLRVQHDTHERILGVPFVVHPIKVATTLLHLMPSPTTQQVIEALLHDSVEDEPLRLVRVLRGDSTPVGVEKPRPTIKQVSSSEEAYNALGERYGKMVSEAIRMVTLPDFSSGVRQKIEAGDERSEKEIKIDLYTEHVLHVLKSTSDASVVKMADLWDNALARHPGEDEKRLAHVRRRYTSVVTKLPTLMGSLPQEHPLFVCRKVILQELDRQWHLFSVTTSPLASLEV